MSFLRLPVKASTRLFLSLGLLFALATLITLLAVRDELMKQAVVEAESKARIILTHEIAAHEYFSQELRPTLLEWSKPFRDEDYFEASWMSSSYALRRIGLRFNDLIPEDYYEKICTIDARNPGNEANDYERDFILELNRDPYLVKKSKVEMIDGQPYFVVVRRGLVMEESCLQCHGDPSKAPAGLIAQYGSERGFNRTLDKTVTAISVRVPLKETYAEAATFSIRLSGLFFTVLVFLFLIQHLLQRRLFLAPLQKIHDKALQIAASDLHLGERIAPPTGEELSELTEAFNRMSENLKVRVSEREAAEEALQKAQALLERRVEQRTAELSRAYEQLKLEIHEKNRVEEDLIHERDFVESLVNTAQAIILVLDNEGRTVRFNPYLEFISGYRLDDVRGKDWFDIFLAPGDSERIRGIFLPTDSTRRVRGYVYPIVTKEGKERQIEWYNEDLNRSDGTRIGILSIGQDITERKKAEEALKLSETRLRTLYSQLLKAQEEERRKISKEVHDSIGSPLAAVKIGLENACMQSEKGRADPQSFRALVDLAQHAMRECRRIMTDLRPSVLDDYGIVATIGWFCDRFQMVNPDIRIEKRILVSERQVPESLRIVLFRVAQEALNNAARHSGASSITVSLERDDKIELCIRDDGRGFDLKSVLARKSQDGGFGISNMEERTELSGGSFRIETGPGRGTAVFARWSF
ncbi:MAG: DUF3365 domain-containing protein [Syntrophobacteraceae bacterium]